MTSQQKAAYVFLEHKSQYMQHSQPCPAEKQHHGVVASQIQAGNSRGRRAVEVNSDGPKLPTTLSLEGFNCTLPRSSILTRQPFSLPSNTTTMHPNVYLAILFVGCAVAIPCAVAYYCKWGINKSIKRRAAEEAAPRRIQLLEIVGSKK